jgi:hypothetical protein
VASGGTVTLTRASFVSGTVDAFLDHATGTPVHAGRQLLQPLHRLDHIPLSGSAGSYRLIAVGPGGARTGVTVKVSGPATAAARAACTARRPAADHNPRRTGDETNPFWALGRYERRLPPGDEEVFMSSRGCRCHTLARRSS